MLGQFLLRQNTNISYFPEISLLDMENRWNGTGHEQEYLLDHFLIVKSPSTSEYKINWYLFILSNIIKQKKKELELWLTVGWISKTQCWVREATHKCLYDILFHFIVQINKNNI